MIDQFVAFFFFLHFYYFDSQGEKGLQGTVWEAAGAEMFCELSIYVLSSTCSSTASSLSAKIIMRSQILPSIRPDLTVIK